MQQQEHVRCQEKCNKKGGKRDSMGIVCLSSPFLPPAILSLYRTCPLFPCKGIRNLLGTRGNEQMQIITNTPDCCSCWLREAPTWEKGQGSQPQHLPCSLGAGAASQDRWHKGTRGLQVTLRSPSYRTSNLASQACQPCPVLMPNAPSATLSGVMLIGACGTLCPCLGGEGVAIRNEKQGPGRCPALF